MIRIPRFGAKWQFAVVQGTGLPQLALGPGHVPGTALPGKVGNFAVAGHRVTAGNPFWNLPDLRSGNTVYVETVAGTYEYKVPKLPQGLISRVEYRRDMSDEPVFHQNATSMIDHQSTFTIGLIAVFAPPQ